MNSRLHFLHPLLILCVFSSRASADDTAVDFLTLDPSIREELYEKSERVRKKFKRTHGYLRLRMEIETSGRVGSVVVLEKDMKKGDRVGVVDAVSAWRFESIPDSMLPLNIDYRLCVNEKHELPVVEEDYEKQMLIASVMAASQGMGYNAGLFLFPSGDTFVRIGQVYEVEYVVIAEGDSVTSAYIGGGTALGFLIGPKAVPVSLFADLKVPVGFIGSFLIGIGSDQMIMARIGGKFRVVLAAGLFEKISVGADGTAPMWGARASAGVEF